MSVIVAGELETEIRNRFSKEISPGFGAVITMSGGNFIIYREVKKINDRIEDGFALDFFCVGAQNLFGSVYVAFCLEGSSDISVEKYKEELVFDRLNRQIKKIV